MILESRSQGCDDTTKQSSTTILSRVPASVALSLIDRALTAIVKFTVAQATIKTFQPSGYAQNQYERLECPHRFLYSVSHS